MNGESKGKALEELTEAIIQCIELERAKSAARKAINLGARPLEVVEAISRGLEAVGDLYEKGEYFLMELTLAGSTSAEIMRMIRTGLKAGGPPVRGRVVIGTVEGDLHYIGKDIVIAMLESRGFEVINLGVDVPAEAFMKAVKEYKPDIVAMSGLLTIVVGKMRDVVDELKEEKLRGSVKIMIGGRAVSSKIASEIGADGYGANAVEAVRLASKWVGEERGGG